MVKGLDRFREYFVDFEDSYALIGGVSLTISALLMKEYSFHSRPERFLIFRHEKSQEK